MTTLLVHHCDNIIVNILNTNYNTDLITFDDGLYSQYLFKDKIINTNRIYFICPSLIDDSNKSNEIVDCRIALSNHFKTKHNKYYMSIYHIKDLIKDGYELGAHSFTHQNIKYDNKLKKINLLQNKNMSFLMFKSDDWIKKDTEQLLNWFSINLNYVPTSYSFPFNQSNDKIINILKTFGFTKFYGDERIELKD